MIIVLSVLIALAILNMVLVFVCFTHLMVTLQINQRIAKSQTEGLCKIFECIALLATASKNMYERIIEEEERS